MICMKKHNNKSKSIKEIMPHAVCECGDWMDWCGEGGSDAEVAANERGFSKDKAWMSYHCFGCNKIFTLVEHCDEQAI